ncbi:MAG TPA: mechanosensitive ion channel [Actinomycetota bacterium]|nr:mechanosensitive ion channel [Actinomycetota bacterium]
MLSPLLAAILDPAEPLPDRLAESFRQFGDRLVGQVANLVAALLFLVITVLVARAVRRGVGRALRRTSTEAHVELLVAKLAYFAVAAVGVVIALSVGGVNLGVLVGSLGLATVALGFALQDIVSNLAAGVVLLLEHPFTRGDHIAVDGAEGTVEDIRVRATQLRSPDGQRVLVPNKLLFTEVLTNSSATMRRRVEVLLDLPYGQDAARARELLLAAAAGVDGVNDDPPPRLLTEDLGESALSLRLWFWVDPRAADLVRVRSAVLEATEAALRENSLLAAPEPVQPTADTRRSRS